MKITFDITSGLSIQGEWIGLERIFPVVNGSVITPCQIKRIKQGEDAFAIQYFGSENFHGEFILEVIPEGQEKCRIRFHIKNIVDDLISFGIYISEISNIKQFLRNGFSSTDGSWYDEPENFLRVEGIEYLKVEGFAMTQLIPRYGVGSMVLGFDRHDRFQHVFTFSTERTPLSLSIETIWDHKTVIPGITCSSEWLEIFDHNGVEEAVKVWAQTVSDASILKPRVNHAPIIGYDSWLNSPGFINEEKINYSLERIKEISGNNYLRMKAYLIGNGFTPELGDWLEVKSEISGGFRNLLKNIQKAGLSPGLWIAPFLVGNHSKVYLLHNDWVLHDRKTGFPQVYMKSTEDCKRKQVSDEYYVLDTTHPEAFEYLQIVFKTWKKEWGVDFFITDFMNAGCLYGPDKVRYYAEGKTRIEVWHQVAEMIREEIGDSIWTSCDCPLWVSIGIVDSVRICSAAGMGCYSDISLESLNQDLVNRNYLNHILWQIDPGFFSLDNNNKTLSPIEVEARAILAGMSGGLMVTGDNFDALDESQIQLWKLFLSEKRQSARYPFMGKSSVIYEINRDYDPSENVDSITRENLDPVIVQVRDGSSIYGPHSVFIYNSGSYSVQRTIPVESLGLNGPLYVYEWRKFEIQTETKWHLQVILEPHEGKLLFLSKEPLKRILDSLS